MDNLSSSKRNRILVIIFVTCMIFYIVYISINSQSTLRKICYQSWSQMGGEAEWDSENNTVKVGNETLKRNIFLIETTGREDMHPRQLCAIESAAKYNPDFNVIVYLKNAKPKPILTLLSDYYDVMYRQLNVEEMFKKTPLEALIKSGKIQRSKYIVHMSDLVRLMILWQHGGIYLDLDVIVFKSLARLENFAIRENEKTVANGVIGFHKKHPVMKTALEIFASKYNPNEFSSNGPALITTAIKTFCKEDSLEYIPVLDCDVNIYPRRTAYEIYYTERDKFFQNDTNSVELSLKRINKSLMTHLWNYLTAKTEAKIGDNTLLEVLMKQHCPLVYGDRKNRGLRDI